jgi:hypothetical protein
MLRAMQIRGLLVVSLACSALPVLSGGCAYGEVRQVIRAQFASDVGCTDVKLKRRDAWYAAENPHQYKIVGCGVTRSYTCTNEQAEGLVSYDEPACTWVEGDADAPKAKVMPVGDDMMDAPMDEPPMDEPSMDEPSEPETSGGEDDLDADADAEADVEADAPKGKAKAKAKGSFKLGGD